MDYSTTVLPEAPARIHLVGIKGQAMTALAQILQGHGYEVTGSDVDEIFPTDAVLRRLGVSVTEGFSPDNISKDVALVVYSTAYNVTHVELQQAAKLDIPTLPHPLLQAELMSIAANRVCVAGTHGKTTTSAMLSRILEDADLNPTALIGAPVSGWNANARSGGDDVFVLEADEYQNKLQYYTPTHSIVTSVDFDHPDVFPDMSAYKQVFVDFVKKMPSTAYLLLAHQAGSMELADSTAAQIETYGLKENSNWLIANIQFSDGQMKFEIQHNGESLGIFELAYTGVHYALDATAAVAMAQKFGVSTEQCKKTLRSYKGTARRQEKIGEYKGALVFDDYAHHPAEISLTIDAFKDTYPGRRLLVVFEAHTYTRTEALLEDFAIALAKADFVCIPPIFGSAREDRGKITPQGFADAINRAGGNAKAKNDFDHVLSCLKGEIKEGDIVVTMGAGDVWQVAKELAQNV